MSRSDILSTLMKTYFQAGKLLLICCLGAISAMAADTVTGTVHNQSTGQASAGDDVLLVNLGEGMKEASRTKTDAQGAFSLSIPASDAQYIVRVMHQGVNYDQTMRGKAPLEVRVFDAVAKIPGLSGNMGIAQIESDGGKLKVTEMYSIRNTSNPPVTQSRPRNYEIVLPPDASLDSIDARSGEGLWVKIPPVSDKGESNHYALAFPLRPGDTLIKYAYHLPARGATALHLHLSYPIQRFAVIHPPSMRFRELKAGTFKNPGIADGVEIDEAAVEPVVSDIPAFEISGSGAMAAVPHPPAGAAPAVPPAEAQSPVIPPPVTPPAPAERDGKLVWILVSAAVVLLGVGLFIGLRARKGSAAESTPEISVQEALQNELRELDAEFAGGSISQEEYAETRAALNLSLQRAMAKKES
jgi:hypothetical protein